MGPIKPYLPDCGRRREETSRVDGQGLVLCLMDGLRNGPYRMCHTASGDVLMRRRGEGRFSRLYGQTRGGSGTRRTSSQDDGV